jgi:Ca2+:H+ antiporter
VNYVTADAKTNWMEGMILIAFYLMIVRLFSNTPYVIADEDRTEQGIVTWFYPGQVEVKEFVGADAVADAIVKGPRSLHS